MKIAILGYGVEGKSVETYFKDRADVTIFDNFKFEEVPTFSLDKYDLVFRSPSISPRKILDAWQSQHATQVNLTSITKYFFDHCPAPILGVTGTKGKGTTCSLATAMLEKLGVKTWLVGNIGNPALDDLDQIQPTDAVVYELSSFQLWDITKSPHIGVVLRIEPEHLDNHGSYEDYFNAKANIARFQTAADTCVYYEKSSGSRQIAQLSLGTKISYPLSDNPALISLLDELRVPGAHNRENTEAALAAVSAFLKISPLDLIQNHRAELTKALNQFRGLPHHIEFLRELNGVKYYDDNYSTSYPALDVALQAFPDTPIVLIAGGKSHHVDLTATRDCIFNRPNLHKAILIGETKPELAKGQDPIKYQFADTLAEAVAAAKEAAEAVVATGAKTTESAIVSTAQTSISNTPNSCVVLMSPAAASQDMFKNYTDRGNQFQQLVQGLI